MTQIGAPLTASQQDVRLVSGAAAASPVTGALRQPSLSLPFTPRLPPLAHQAAFLRDHALDTSYALFWEQGTGKTKALIDNVALLLMRGDIDGVFLLAPNGVHYNWFYEELPKHWPADATPYRAFFWDVKRSGNVGHQKMWEGFNADVEREGRGVPWLCMSYDGLITDAGKAASWAFMKRRRVMYIADESQRIKTPASYSKKAGRLMKGKSGTERTATVTNSSVYAAFRRIASGTPMDKPLDIYSQVFFLDPDFWQRQLGTGNFFAFKALFSQIINIKTNAGKSFPKLVGYQRLEELERAVARIGSRVLKEDALDLPPKTYKRLFHELSPEQTTAWQELKQDAVTVLETGEVITATMALVFQLRATQITCGFLGGAGDPQPIPFRSNPRAQLLVEALSDLTRPAIVWHRFKHDEAVIQLCSRMAGRTPVVFVGSDPAGSLGPWHAGHADVLVGNLASGLTEGHTLNEADTTIYYSRTPRLITRLQSEDRNHRIGQTRSVTYVDLLASRTTDARDLDALRAKRGHVGSVLGDPRAATDSWLLEEVGPRAWMEGLAND